MPADASSDILHNLLNHRGIDVNIKDDLGETSLHKALASNNTSAVILLLTHNATCFSNNMTGRNVT